MDLKIILSNPFCEQFIRRALIEEKKRLKPNNTGKDFFENSQAIDDIKQSMRAIEENMFLNKNFQGEGITRNEKISQYIKFSNDYPLMWLIITDDFAFFQPYQYGNLSENPIMGENFFVLQIRDGIIYKRLLEHFKFLWEAKDRPHSNCSFDQIYQMMFPPDKGIKKISEILGKIIEFDNLACPTNDSCQLPK
jgi:hypothetical protein